MRQDISRRLMTRINLNLTKSDGSQSLSNIFTQKDFFTKWETSSKGEGFQDKKEFGIASGLA